MKKINTNPNVQFIYNNDGKIKGFAGRVKVYDQYFYVDTKTGKGYDDVVNKMDRFIKNMAYEFDFSSDGFDFEDAKQYITMLLLEGIRSYNPNKGMSLSSFLHFKVKRSIINKIASYSLLYNNPTVLDTCLFSVSCECGFKYTVALEADRNIKEERCKGCQSILDNAQIFMINTPPQKFNDLVGSDDEYMSGEESVSYSDDDVVMIFGSKSSDINSIIDIENAINSQTDIRIKNMLYMILEDISIYEASHMVGISHTWGNIKIKNLRENKLIVEALGRE